jgi:hypothetical protein
MLLAALEEARRVLGPEHHDALRAAADLARKLYEEGEIANAQALQEEVLETWQRVLGAEHQDTIDAAATLASYYREGGRAA